MAFTAYFATLATSANTGSSRARVCTKSHSAPRPPSLACGGCGAPLPYVDGPCTYCRLPGASGGQDWLSRNVAELYAGLEPLAVGVDMAAPDSDQTAVWTRTDSGFALGDTL